jgi:nucleoside-diphosphate-sugar epimerase
MQGVAAGSRYLVTGAMGCLGAWTMRLLVDSGAEVVGADLSTDPRRLRLVAGDAVASAARFVTLDITDTDAVRQLVQAEHITHVIHLAALQAPFCKADPPRGAAVNVMGTVNIFEAVIAARDQVRSLVYASSSAVFGPATLYPGGLVTDDSPTAPSSTLYGVFKQANEWSARAYAETAGLASVGLRPFIVYGPGRDQGLTSGPTVAILAALSGVPFHIPFGGHAVFQFAEDVAGAFVAASAAEASDALVLNVGGPQSTVAGFVDALEAVVPEARRLITFEDDELPFPSCVDDSGLQRLVGGLQPIPLEDGIARSVAIFRDALQRGTVAPPPVLAR